MELNELLAQGQKELEAEVTRVLAEREYHEAAKAAKEMAYMTAVETTLHTALPECVWRYLDYSKINAEREYREFSLTLTVPGRAPIYVDAYLTISSGGYIPGSLKNLPFTVPWVDSQMPTFSEEGGVEYYYTTERAIRTKSLPYALAVAEQRQQEFEFEQGKFDTTLLLLQKQYEAREAAKKAKVAQQTALTAEDRLRQALADLVTDVLDSALAAREM